MAHKLALTLAVLAVSFAAINAATTAASPSSSFNVTPVAVVDNSTDTNFVNYTSAVFVAGLDNTTLFVYGVNFSTTDKAVQLVRRQVNASTLATINGSDSKISTTFSANSSYRVVGGLGYIAVLTIYNSTGNFPDVTLSYSAVNGSFASVKLTSNTDENTTYYVTSVWYETGYFYVAYASYNASTSTDLAGYIQAVKVSDGSKLFTAPVKVATLNATIGSSALMAGPTNSTNSSTINVLYKTSTANSTYLVVLTINGSTVGTPVTLYTDANNITYWPAGTLGSTSNSAVFCTKSDASASPATNSTYGFWNGNTTAVVVASSTMSGYAAPYIGGGKFVDGYYLIEAFAPASTGETAYYIDYYFANSTRNGSAMVSLGTFGSGLQPFLDANGAVWGGYYTRETWLMKASVGKIIAQTNAASILANFAAFIALMIAALFAF